MKQLSLWGHALLTLERAEEKIILCTFPAQSAKLLPSKLNSERGTAPVPAVIGSHNSPGVGGLY